ncbi:MAG: phosphoribosylglycinamide formyltransferase, partial [Candidatus Binatia bacterium]
PVIIQAVVPVFPADTEEVLAARILKVEHQIYPRAIQLYSEGRLHVVGRRVVVDGLSKEGEQMLVWPPLRE